MKSVKARAFSDLEQFCSETIEKIVEQYFQNPEVSVLKNTLDLNPESFAKHLKDIAFKLNLTTRGEVPATTSIPIKNKLLALDVVNFCLKKNGDTTTEDDIDFQKAAILAKKLHYTLPSVCNAALGSNKYIQKFAEEIGVPTEHYDAYKIYFRETTGQLIEEISRFALTCSDRTNPQFQNYFSEIPALQDKVAASIVSPPFFEIVHSTSSLHDIRETMISRERSGSSDKKISSSTEFDDQVGSAIDDDNDLRPAKKTTPKHAKHDEHRQEQPSLATGLTSILKNSDLFLFTDPNLLPTPPKEKYFIPVRTLQASTTGRSPSASPASEKKVAATLQSKSPTHNLGSK